MTQYNIVMIVFLHSVVKLSITQQQTMLLIMIAYTISGVNQ